MSKCKYPNLRSAAESKGVTQGEMADLIGIKPHTFSYRMCGVKGEFTIREAWILKQVMFPEYPLEYLFKPAL